MPRGRRSPTEAQKCDHCGTADPAQFIGPRHFTCIACRRAQKQAATKRWAERNGDKLRQQRRDAWGPEKQAVAKAWRDANREKVLASKRRYAAKHADHIKKKNHDYHAANAARLNQRTRERWARNMLHNPDIVRAKRAKWRKDNRELKRASNRRYKKRHPDKVRNEWKLRRIREAKVERTLTLNQWNEILESFNHACAYCLARGQALTQALTQDHIHPISQGGPHSADNVIPACNECNARKGNRGILSMLRYIG